MDKEPRIFVLSDDAGLSGDLRSAIDESFSGEVFIAPSVSAARNANGIDEYDLFIADAALEDAEFIAFVGEATSNGIPTILIDDSPLVAERVLGALRLGVIDVVPRPVDFTHLEEIARVTLDARRQAKNDFRRQTRLRELSTRMIRDRRELRQRIDLLCKDLVTAYRRLAEKVVAFEDREA